MRVDGMRLEGTGGDESIKEPDRHPEGAPHGVDDGDERVSRAEAMDASDELCETTEEADLVHPRISMTR